LSCSAGEQTLPLEILRLAHDALPAAGRLLGGRVRQYHLSIGERDDLGDTAAHVARSDHGDAFGHSASSFSTSLMSATFAAEADPGSNRRSSHSSMSFFASSGAMTLAPNAST